MGIIANQKHLSIMLEKLQGACANCHAVSTNSSPLTVTLVAPWSVEAVGPILTYNLIPTALIHV